MNKVKIEEWVALYKRDFAERWSTQEYKWIAVEKARKHWDVDDRLMLSTWQLVAEELGKKAKRLLRPSFSRMTYGMLHEFIEHENAAIRDMLQRLYAVDVRAGVDDRIACYLETFSEIKERRRLQDKPNWEEHFQAKSTTTVLLWMKYPEMFIYAEPEWLAYGLKELGFPYTGNRVKFKYEEEGLPYFDCLKQELTKPEYGLKELLRPRLIQDKHYADCSLSLLCNDFLEYVGREVKRLSL